MALSHCFSSLFLLLVIFLFTNPTLSDAETQDLIDKVCRQMEEYGFCNQAFHENMKTPTADLGALTEITINQALKNATNTYDFIEELLKKTADPNEKNALVGCENGYGLAKTSFQNALQMFNKKDYDGMLKEERVTPRALSACEGSFGTPSTPQNPMVGRNRQMRILVAMAVVTGHELLVQ